MLPPGAVVFLAAVSAQRHRVVIAASLVFAVFLWGGNNAGVKFIVQSWPPIFTGATRFVLAGLLMLALLRWTTWFGRSVPLTREASQHLWWRGGLVLAVYIACFNWAVQLTAVSHVALYLGASPVWALLWEGRAGRDRFTLFKRYAAALLALAGVITLFWPALKESHGSLVGELLGLACSVLWTNYGRQCRTLGKQLPGPTITAHTMWRAGVLLLPLALVEVAMRGMSWRWDAAGVQAYCIVAGGVVAFGLWNNALRHWKTSEVYLFNNLIPLSSTLWAHFTLGEAITSTFWLAMVLIVSGVVLGQTSWERLLGGRWVPTE